MRLWAGLAFALGVHVVLALSASVPQVHNGGGHVGYLALAHSLVEDGAYRELWHPGEPDHTKFPPLYPAFLAAMILAGATTWGAFKASSIALTALATAFCFLWARRLRGDRAGVVVAVLFGASYAVLFAAQGILSEPLFLVATMGCLWLLAPGKVEPKPRWELAAALALAVAAYFTRSAGVPLIVAAGLWLAIGRRWKELGVFAAVLAVPVFLWGRASAGDYASEFWLINPYAPDLGRAGLWELVVRAVTNAWKYASDYVPNGLAGSLGGVAAVVGIALTVATLAEWLRRVRSGPGVAELFLVLYCGLLAAWPWSGNRFALPILPLVLLYAYASVARLAKFWVDRRPAPEPAAPGAVRENRWRRLTSAAALAATVAVPAGLSWDRLRDPSLGCDQAIVAKGRGPWSCYPENYRVFHVMALWAGDHLPEGSVVYSHRPSLFYAYSGLQSVAYGRRSVTYPFAIDGSRFMAMADSLGIGYVARSRWGGWDGSEASYVDPVVAAHPERFCQVARLQSPTESIWMLAILPPLEGEAERPSQTSRGTELRECPPEGGSTLPSQSAVASMTVPFPRTVPFLRRSPPR